MMKNPTKTWMITGASKGLGMELVKQLLAAGHNVAATSRNTAALKEAANNTSDSFLPLEVDITDDVEVNKAISKVIDSYGKIDVVINNAGYGIGGSLEELSDAEIRNAFNVNVFATINVVRHVLPHMRMRRGGHIINIASIAGITANTGWAAYAGAKFAVVGLTEVLADDVKEFGIHVTAVIPGAFRTSFLSAESIALPQHPLPEYLAVRESTNKYLQMDGAQTGDPARAASEIIKSALESNPPLHLFLGSDAYQRALAKANQLQQEVEASKSTAFSTDY
jgi:short-subunit dehydrogenase